MIIFHHKINLIMIQIMKRITTLKMKIGALDFKTELNILQGIRKHYRSSELELRVDANGAFTKEDALAKLTFLPLEMNQ